MRKLLLKMSVSVDGFVGGPNGEIDWLLNNPDNAATEWTMNIIWQAGLHIMGSRTFHDMASWWPTSTEVYAAPMNAIPKAVFTRKGISSIGDATQTTTALKQSNLLARAGNLSQAPTPALESWKNALILTGDLAEEVRKLKAQPGKPIVAHGGASFCRSLVATGLIDEFHLLTYPILLGAGLPVFSALAHPIPLKLIDVKPFANGAIAHSYLPAS